jgi:hypothetical protein
VPLSELPRAASTWVRWLAWAERLRRPGRPLSLSTLLARHGHGLLRRVMEQAWIR